MSVREALGRQTLRVGTAPVCEIQLSAPYPAQVLALVVHLGEGRLAFVAELDGVCTSDGVPLPAGQPAMMEAGSHFSVGETSLSQETPLVAAMLWSKGSLYLGDDTLIIGRDPARCHLVLASPFLSAVHLSVNLPGLTAFDHNSTSGSSLDGEALEPEVSTKLGPTSILSLGPHALPVALLIDLHAELNVPVAPAPEGFGASERDTAPAPEGLTGFAAGARGVPSTELPPRPARKHSTVLGTIRMVPAHAYRIGRTKDNDIVLSHAQLSSHHARLHRIGSRVYLEDADSELGTYVRGTRLRSAQKAEVSDGESIRFGPVTARLAITESDLQVILDDREDWAGRPLLELEAQGLSVLVDDRDLAGTKKALLTDISFKALPGDFIALMGPSGSGKSTLLHALTGYTPCATGRVLVNGQPLTEAFDTLRGSIGYVPQDDIIHPELTVFEAVRYSARFRLPQDYSSEEIDQRVHSTLARLGLSEVANLQIGAPEQKVISGGQRKRVNIAMELVTDPVLLFLDEPTSGLAADDTTALIELLAGLAREQGKTIIATIHQPAKDEYEKFNLSLVLGHGGHMLYFGRTEDAYAFFESWRPARERHGLATPRDIFAELAEREARLQRSAPDSPRGDIQKMTALSFAQDYQNSKLRELMLSGARAPDRQTLHQGVTTARRVGRGQLSLLLSRYLRIKLRDRTGTAILLLQAPLIGVLLALVFGRQKPSVPYWCLGALESLAGGSGGVSLSLGSPLQRTSDNAGALFFLVVSAVWFGTSNAAREIVSERAIFRRESMINLRSWNYVLSKFLILGCLCFVQCSMLLAIVFPALRLEGGLPGFGQSLTTLVLTALCSVALGLALSSFVRSSEAAMALTPIALIPQVVLGGLMVPVTTNPLLAPLMWFIPARWGFDGVVRTERALVDELPGWSIPLPDAPTSLPDFIYQEKFHCALAQLQSSDLPGAWGFGSGEWATHLPWLVLTSMTALLLALVTLILRQRH